MFYSQGWEFVFCFVFYYIITSVFCKNTHFVPILVFGEFFPGLFCSYILVCLIVTFHLLLTGVPGVVCPSCSPWCPSPPHLSPFILVTSVSFLFPPSLFAASCVSHLSPGPELCSCLPLSVPVLPRVPLGLLSFYSYGFLCRGLCFGRLPWLYWASLCLPLLPYPLGFCSSVFGLSTLLKVHLVFHLPACFCLLTAIVTHLCIRSGSPGWCWRVTHEGLSCVHHSLF